jgi:threonine dehydratase
MSGTSISAKALCPQAQIIGAEPKNADDACRSLKSGQLVLSDNPETMADGLRTSLSDLTWEIIRTHVNEIFTASESSIKAAMVLLKKQAAILAEPSSAVPLAALLENRSYFEGKRVGMIISGGNYDPELLED